MAYVRIRLVHLETDTPVYDGHWAPYVRPEELEQANQNLIKQQLPWRWIPFPLTTECTSPSTLDS